jgi:hypothetical protein
MILLWGIIGDGPLASIYREIERQKLPVFFLDQQAVLETELELCVERGVKGILRTRSHMVKLEEITSAYIRPYDSRRLGIVKQHQKDSSVLYHALGLEDGLVSWCEVTPAFVINRPSAMASNNSKPYQAMLIRSLGINVPVTLVTTDVDAALAFWEKHGSVIFKSVSGVRSVVSQLTNKHRSALQDITNCPTQFQEYIAGNDYRVHVVGDEIFASEIRCIADDYRYAGKQGVDVDIHPCPLPQDIAERCRALATSLGLPVAGIDLRRTPAGEWYCFEVNPSPGFTFYQEATGQPISKAIVHLLAHGSSFRGVDSAKPLECYTRA